MPTKTKTTKKTKILNVVFVWDKSGSMSYLRESALEGATSYIKDLVGDKNAKNIRMSITTFDTKFNKLFVDQPVAEIPVTDLYRLYQPDGMTALNDAVADAIFTMDKRLAEHPEEKVLIVVLTDGQENSSREFGGPDGTARLAVLVKDREEAGNWTFVYLGAGSPQKVAAVAMNYNIPAGNTMSYAATNLGTATSFNTVSEVTRHLSSSSRGQTVTAMADVGLKSASEQEDENDR